MPKRINEAGLNLLKGFESFEPDWYLDPVNVKTIGWGHTGPLPEGFTAPLTEEEANHLLRFDLNRFERSVDSACRAPLTGNQFSALTSLVYNIGENAFQRSTLLKRLNAGRYEEAADEFLRWVYAGGRKLNGLVRRREAERMLFLTPPDRERGLMAKAEMDPREKKMDPLPPEQIGHDLKPPEKL